MNKVSSLATTQIVPAEAEKPPESLTRDILHFAINTINGEKPPVPGGKEIFHYATAASTGAIAYRQLSRNSVIRNPILRILLAGMAGAGGFAISRAIAPPSGSTPPPPPDNNDPKTRFPQLFSEPPPPFIMPGEIAVTKVASDGNCLFHSIAAWLTKNQEFSQETDTLKGFDGQLPSQSQLREHAVKVLKEKKDEPAYLQALQNAVEAHNFAKKTSLDEEEDSLTVAMSMGNLSEAELENAMMDIAISRCEMLKDKEGYLESAGKNRFFGGAAEILALSNALSLNVQVYRQIDGIMTRETDLLIVPEGKEASDNPTIYLVHTGNHFNLLDY